MLEKKNNANEMMVILSSEVRKPFERIPILNPYCLDAIRKFLPICVRNMVFIFTDLRIHSFFQHLLLFFKIITW